jgi:TPR repeat protein
MSITATLCAFGLRQVIEVAAGPIGNVPGYGEALQKAIERGAEPAAAQVLAWVESRFTDPAQKLPRALARANDRAWQALAVALAGDGWFDSIKVFFLASGDEKGLREEVRRLLAGQPFPFAGTPADFRRGCLAELKQAKKEKLLSADALDHRAVARQTADLRRYADATGLINGACQAVTRVANGLAPRCPNLATLLRQRPAGGPPLLAAAFAYFFRREVEKDGELARGLTFDGLRQLAAGQEAAFGEVGRALDALGERFDEVVERLGRIEAVVVETHGVAVSTHGAVLDMHAELQRLGGLHLANVGAVKQLIEQVLARLAQVGMHLGEVRPQDGFSIRSEDERRAVRQLLARFRQLPAKDQRKVTALLNGLGKLQAGMGDFGGAKKTFLEVAGEVADPRGKAEACYNAYRAALEERKWDEALKSIREAAALDRQRFAPFPMQRYEARRILGAGGFGTAFLCHDRSIKADVVVKTLHAAHLDRSPEDVFGEAQALRLLRHPAIIEFLDCNCADPNLTAPARPYIVMAYFPGVSLEAFVAERGVLSPANLLVVARQVAEGMQAAHARGVLHRDVKPENVLVRKEGNRWRVKVIDFGLALRRQTIETSARRAAGEETILANSVAGTIRYAPPEQMGRLRDGKGRLVPVGPYSDVFAFGKLCCYALFKTTEPKGRHWATSAEHERLREVLERCIDEELEHRHAGFEPVLAALKALEAETGPDEDEREDDTLANDLRESERRLSVRESTREYLTAAAPLRLSAWRAAAEKGNPNGQVIWGDCLEEGIGVSQDYAEAVKWYRMAAEQGFASGQTYLGLMYKNGRGMAQDHAEAVKWFRKAAEQGNAFGQNELGGMYENGRGVSRDYAEAVKWYRKAAEQGFASGQNNLGRMYLNGLGVAQDHAEAVKWYRKAAEQGNAAWQVNLGWMYEKGLGVAQDYAEAVQWYRKAAEQGYASGQNNLGRMYLYGLGVTQNYAEAVKWARKAAEQGNPAGQNNLGEVYEKGLGVAQDHAEAVKWFRKAAEQGHPLGQVNLGWMYKKGRGVAQDHAEAVKWYRKAAEQGYARGQYNLGWMYEYGEGVARDDTEAVRWYRKAAEQGNADAKKSLERLLGTAT